MKVPGPQDGQVFLCWVTLPLSVLWLKITVNGVKTKCQKFNSFVNMFVFLFSSVNFLLLFLFTTIKVTSDINIGIIAESFKSWQDCALIDQSGADAVIFY